MEPIQCQTIITSIRSRRDGSLGFSAETPELSDEEKVAFMRLQNQILIGLFTPEGSTQVPKEIKTEVRTKTQSQRIRGVLYRLWEQEGKPDEDFELFYRSWTEKIIIWLKGKLE